MKHLINWVEIPVTDMDRACRFYGTVVGVECSVWTWGLDVRSFPYGGPLQRRGPCQRSGSRGTTARSSTSTAASTWRTS